MSPPTPSVRPPGPAAPAPGSPALGQPSTDPRPASGVPTAGAVGPSLGQLGGSPGDRPRCRVDVEAARPARRRHRPRRAEPPVPAGLRRTLSSVAPRDDRRPGAVPGHRRARRGRRAGGHGDVGGVVRTGLHPRSAPPHPDRRAGPGYPYDLEARIEAQLARQAPAPSGRVSLEGLVTAVQEASVISIDAPVNASRREYAYVKQVLKRGLAWYLRHVADQVSSLGYATARTLRAITVDLEDIEERVAAVEHRGERDAAESLPEATDTESHLSEWLDQVAGQLVGVNGRVLCADAQVDEVVARLRGDGLDAYGLTRDGSPYLLSPDVRQGDLIAHLGSVGDGALGATVL